MDCATKKLRIANVIRRFAFDEWGGTENVVWNTSKKLSSLGHSVEVVGTQALCKVPTEKRDGVRICRFPYFYPYLFLKSENMLDLDKKGGNPFSWSLYKYICSQRFDIIHSHTMGRLGKMALKAARKMGVPFLVSLHGGQYDVPQSEMEEMQKPLKGSLGYGRFLEKIFKINFDFLAKADGVICVGKNEFDRVREKFPDKPAIYLPNGVDPEKFNAPLTHNFRQKYGIPDTDILLLCVSRIDYQKNQRLLVDLVRSLRNSGKKVHCAIIGFVTSQSYYQSLLDDIKKADLEEYFIVIPGLSPDSELLLSAYKDADMFVLPSAHEPFGIVILEAWSAGLLFELSPARLLPLN